MGMSSTCFSSMDLGQEEKGGRKDASLSVAYLRIHKHTLKLNSIKEACADDTFAQNKAVLF